MSYWIGSEAAITDAERVAFAAYYEENPTATDPDGNIIPNPTMAWAIPMQTDSGQWAIIANDRVDAPDGCELVDHVDWSDEDEE